MARVLYFDLITSFSYFISGLASEKLKKKTETHGLLLDPPSTEFCSFDIQKRFILLSCHTSVCLLLDDPIYILHTSQQNMKR